MRRNSVSILFLIAFAATGCVFNAHKVFPDGTGGVTGIEIGPGSGGSPFARDAAVELIAADSVEEMSPSIDANCGNVPFDVKPNPADLLIVLDKSGSMAQDASGANCRTAGCSKWDQVTAAIIAVVQQTPTINWGLKFFANDNACTVNDGVTVPVGPGTATAVADAINLAAPGGNTPTRAAEASASAYMATLTDPGSKFILLATDGQPNCAVGGAALAVDDPAAIQSVSDAAAAGFSTFVVGIATGASVADTTLNQMAINGGHPRAATPAYYPVTTTDDLLMALNAIKGIVMAPCTYPLASPTDASDPTKLTVTVDGVASVKDDPDGWHYDPGMTTITFTGNTCAQLMAGAATDVQVLYGCKVGPVL
jgi:von Willebrand factor type A domain